MKREPLLSDEAIVQIGCGILHRDDVKKSRNLQHLFNAKYLGALQVRNYYEAARAKDAELIQRLVDALWTVHTGHTDYLDVQDAIDAAKAAGFKPSDE